MASGVSVSLVHAPVAFIMAVRVHVTTCDRAVSDEISSCIANHANVRKHPKPVLDSSHMKALDTNLFDFLSKTHELRDFKKVVALSQAVPADFCSQMLVRIRTRPDSVRFNE